MLRVCRRIGIAHRTRVNNARGERQNDERDENLRMSAAYLLARLGRNENAIAEAALPGLREALDDSNETMPAFAMYAIDRISPGYKQ